MTQRQLNKDTTLERTKALEKYLQEAWNSYVWEQKHQNAYEMGDEFIRCAVNIVAKNLKGVK